MSRRVEMLPDDLPSLASLADTNNKQSPRRTTQTQTADTVNLIEYSMRLFACWVD
jgi:hypothetical protein